jgi:hypothetical protein
MSSWNEDVFLPVIIKLVSSANKMGVALSNKACGKSFMYKRKRRGPKIEP